MNEDNVTTGWDAIEEQMIRLYGTQEPKHYGTMIPYMLGGNDPLDGLSAYKADKPLPHWHIVTFGFSELYEKESKNADYSGFGFELTFRLAREEHEEEPPMWALNLLQNMARYVFNSGNVFVSGDHLDANGPICLGADTKITALAFIEDAELPAVDTENGRVEFIQMVGITEDELEAMKTWSTLNMLEACQKQMPGYITSLSRESVLQDPAVYDAVQKGIERDGSSTGFLFVDQLLWESGQSSQSGKNPAVLTLGAKQTAAVSTLLRGRLLKQRDLILSGQNLKVVLLLGDKSEYEMTENSVRLILDTATIAELSQILGPKEAEIRLSAFDNLIIRVVKTNIKDQDGNIVSIIG